MTVKQGICDMDCEICGGTFEIIQSKDEDAQPADDGTPFTRIVEYRKCYLCGTGMVLYHTPFPK